MDNKTESFKRLLAELNDGTKDIFLQPTTTSILEQAKRAADYNLTKEDILLFRQTLSDVSRAIETKELRGEQRHLSHRHWIAYAPGYNFSSHTCTNPTPLLPRHCHIIDTFLSSSFSVSTVTVSASIFASSGRSV